MSTVPQRATVEDLYRSKGKAELIGGRVVEYMATGVRPSIVATNIHFSMRAHSKRTGQGKAFGDNLGYVVPELPSERESFNPDTSYYLGPMPANDMRFVEGPPDLAVEVRSENDYSPSAEIDLAEKREDYFQAGTKIVWDVDPVAEAIAEYKGDAHTPTRIWKRGDVVDAEPVLPGWRITIDEVFAIN